MKFNDAKLHLKKFIKYRYNDKTFAYQLDRKIIHLSHKIITRKGHRGHQQRQNVRRKLREYSSSEVFRITTGAQIKKGSKIKTTGFTFQTNLSAKLQNFKVVKTKTQQILAIILTLLMIIGGFKYI